MTQQHPSGPERHLIAAGSIRRTSTRTSTVRVTKTGVTGVITKRAAELHRLADQDYASNVARREQDHRADAFLVEYASEAAASRHAPAASEPSNLAVAVGIAERTLDGNNPTAIREALRILLRAVRTQA